MALTPWLSIGAVKRQTHRQGQAVLRRQPVRRVGSVQTRRTDAINGGSTA